MIESFTLDKNFVLTSLSDVEWEYDKELYGFKAPLSIFSNFDTSLLNSELKYIVTESLDGRRTFIRMPDVRQNLTEGQFLIVDDNIIIRPYSRTLNSSTSSKGRVVKFPSLSVYEIKSNTLTASIPNSESKYAIIHISNMSSSTSSVVVKSGDIITTLELLFNDTKKYSLQSTGGTLVELNVESIPIFLNTEIYSIE